MKRSRLRRRTRLVARSELKRYKPLREVSEKRAAASGRPARPRDTGPDRATRDLVLERDGGCVVCGTGPYGLQIHHRKPRRLGGSSDPAINAPSNLTSACEDHHAWIESHRAKALGLGLLLHDKADPAEVPVLHHLYGWVLLHDDGSVTQVSGDAA